MRMGKIRNPQYRIVVADARTKRDGRAIENIGIYHPKEDPSRIEVNSERVQYWLSVGAQPSDPVLAILRKTGDWQKFKGQRPPTTALKSAAPRVDQHAVYEAEAKAAAGLADKPGKGEADKPPAKKKAAKKSAAKKAAPKEAAAKEAAPKEAEAEAPAAPAAEAPAAPAAPAAEAPAAPAAEATETADSADPGGQA
jgi:small subunit ribosomal protein S16